MYGAVNLGRGSWDPNLHPRGDGGQFVTIDLSQAGRFTRVSMVRTDPEHRGQGYARRAMENLVAQADRDGVALSLTPEPLAGDRTTSKRRLTEFYRSLGFKPNTGRARDFETRDTLVREPRGQK